MATCIHALLICQNVDLQQTDAALRQLEACNQPVTWTAIFHRMTRESPLRPDLHGTTGHPETLSWMSALWSHMTNSPFPLFGYFLGTYKISSPF